jgi:hypothetical protein
MITETQKTIKPTITETETKHQISTLSCTGSERITARLGAGYIQMPCCGKVMPVSTNSVYEGIGATRTDNEVTPIQAP